MHTFSILAASALAAIALAKPIPVPQAGTKKGFTVQQSVAKPFQAGPVVLQKVYQKYNKTVPTNVKAAATDGSVTATPEQYDAEYLCPVTIGGQTLNLDFDTGSADLFVSSCAVDGYGTDMAQMGVLVGAVVLGAIWTQCVQSVRVEYGQRTPRIHLEHQLWRWVECQRQRLHRHR